MENLYKPNCIRTVSGKYINVFDPKPEMFELSDLVFALSNIPRFGGHLPVFYSVLEHSINCCLLADAGHEKAALCHDLSEGTGLLDFPSPIKALFPDYKIVEDRVMKVLAEKFEFTYPLSAEVKKVDKIVLELEWNQLMLLKDPEDGYVIYEDYPEQARKLFMEMFNKYKKQN
jgi:uncharacterized protein